MIGSEENISFIYTDVFTEEASYQAVSQLPDFLYEEIKQKAAMIFERFNSRKIPVDVFALADFLGITVIKYSQLTENEKDILERNGISRNSDGFYALARKNGVDRPYIYYNDSKTPGRIRFTLLHEIGHYVLGHKQHSDLAEAMANFFAKYMIAPPVLVACTKPSDYVDIMNAFEASAECAMHSFNYYIKWLRIFHKRGRTLKDYEIKILRAYGYKAG